MSPAYDPPSGDVEWDDTPLLLQWQLTGGLALGLVKYLVTGQNMVTFAKLISGCLDPRPHSKGHFVALPSGTLRPAFGDSAAKCTSCRWYWLALYAAVDSPLSPRTGRMAAGYGGWNIMEWDESWLLDVCPSMRANKESLSHLGALH